MGLRNCPGPSAKTQSPQIVASPEVPPSTNSWAATEGMREVKPTPKSPSVRCDLALLRSFREPCHVQTIENTIICPNDFANGQKTS